MYSVYKLNKADNIQPWCTPFPIWNQFVVPCPVLTVASWPAYRFLKRQVRWSGIVISFRIFHSLIINHKPPHPLFFLNTITIILSSSCSECLSMLLDLILNNFKLTLYKSLWFFFLLVIEWCWEVQYRIASWRKSLGKWQRARSTPALCAVGRKTSPAFGYAWCQDLIINIKDVAWENGLWVKHMGHLEQVVLEIFLLIIC